ncbi:acyltransferase [Emticicia agri]|uniref:Acyltransferase n=1 Tax=Emticicia agri TaxID=2492393 RepID=A0A4Q5LTF2_9BACT|nr:acyltransferase [Emticicia agri]RYU92898.1 acyltransferase [Emticicia agri]
MTNPLYTSVASFPLVRIFTKILMKVFYIADRLYSHMKFRALVKNASKTALCHWTTDIKYGENLTIGERSGINKYCSIGAHSPITIGNDVRISRGSIIETAGLNFNVPPPYKHISNPIVIEDGVWIASNVIVLGGVTIGKGSIIGAGVVVSKSIPPNSIIVCASNRVLDKKTPVHAN